MDSTKIEGWLYVIQPHRLRIRFPRKRYFVLEGRQATCYKSKPIHDGEKQSLKKGVIQPYTKVVDNGRENIHGQVLHTFTLSDPNFDQQQMKLAARTAEEAAKWMSAFRDAASSQAPLRQNLAVPKRKPYFRFFERGREGGQEVPDWTGFWTSMREQGDVIAESPWKILGCKNGLRLFRESSKSKGRFTSKFADDHPAIMAVGVVKAPCESVFDTVMALGDSRSEWDFCYSTGRIVERIDGHTDIVHKQLRRKWLPGHMRGRDLLFHRYWRREYDGSYVILYRSVSRKDCPTRSGTVRANLKSGGYVISPLTGEGEQPARSLVRHMLEIDWNTWKSHFKPSRVQKITLRMLERIAGLRELYKAKVIEPTWVDASGEFDDQAAKEEKEENEERAIVVSDQEPKSAHIDEQESFLRVNDTDEFFDAPDDSDQEDLPDDMLRSVSETEGTEEFEPETKSLPKFSKTASFVKRIHALAAAAHKKGAQPQTEFSSRDAELLDREGTLPKSSFYCSWSAADPSTFLIRGKNYLRDNKKVKAKETLMQLVAVDWFTSNQREDHIASRENTFMQKPKVRKLARSFFFIVNLQVPGSTTYSLVFYYMLKQSLDQIPLLEKFVNGGDRFRSSTFKLIPHVAEGSWIVKQSVGKTACLIGEALDLHYFHGKNYLELDVDVGASSVARGVVSLVFGYMSKLVVEMAFLIQANTEEDLPEMLLGTCRVSSLDVSKAVQLNPSA
ncbi:protein ENHANCED DISEASE RESISTANCE 2 [Selaginella moellendorffii]|uniref:protein ENHANCED DISEASE RESISTANCE 2 n=1 Tax=Selaginella moellendorffii TaxID=88036 RepID=UPI000D1CB2CF|nr:protein ENHANCED DISEASE RESISTANCE 2 [Selaginella moellendorffii]XP_024529541.1 protein ENHANCED DISEASE RESISTANCE 2 [Selaginella moellendorffii]|eukprot:XP_024529536.1 protein ENHANCED DISEASE RESISTANCE 2 [Selaginella moellendorffii]